MTLDQPYILSYAKNLSLACKVSRSKHCYRSQRLLHVPTQWWHLSCREMSSVFPASNALSSSHSRAVDRNKGVDPRPVIIIWECRCKATHFSGLKPRRKGGRNWGWGGRVCGAVEAIGTAIGREFDWKPNPVFFSCCHYSHETQRANWICTLHEHMHNGKYPKSWAAASETGQAQWSSLSICFYPNQYQNMKIFQKKTVMLVDHYGRTTDAAKSWKGLISLNPLSLLFPY